MGFPETDPAQAALRANSLFGRQSQVGERRRDRKVVTRGVLSSRSPLHAASGEPHWRALRDSVEHASTRTAHALYPRSSQSVMGAAGRGQCCGCGQSRLEREGPGGGGGGWMRMLPGWSGEGSRVLWAGNRVCHKRPALRAGPWVGPDADLCQEE